jgi:hypothetical protein
MSTCSLTSRLAAAVDQGRLRPASELPIGPDPSVTRRFLGQLQRPEAGCIELRVLRACWDQGKIRRAGDVRPGFDGFTLAGWFSDVEPLTAQARLLSGVSGYVTINPVSPSLLARSDRLVRVRHTTRDVDIVCLSWLYLDIDAVRPPDISSTEAELAAALARRNVILDENPELAASALWGCSGNGGWILIRLPDYPNDPAHRGLVTQVVRSLARTYTDSAAVIDTAPINPARLIGLPGTVKAKGANRPDRPWRRVTLEGIGRRLVARGG